MFGLHIVKLILFLIVICHVRINMIMTSIGSGIVMFRTNDVTKIFNNFSAVRIDPLELVQSPCKQPSKLLTPKPEESHDISSSHPPIYEGPKHITRRI